MLTHTHSPITRAFVRSVSHLSPPNFYSNFIYRYVTILLLLLFMHASIPSIHCLFIGLYKYLKKKLENQFFLLLFYNFFFIVYNCRSAHLSFPWSWTKSEMILRLHLAMQKSRVSSNRAFFVIFNNFSNINNFI